jgi:anti-sigma regulatory factor (Ser/Thr protein kinase)
MSAPAIAAPARSRPHPWAVGGVSDETVLPATPEAVAAARRHVRGVLSTWRIPPDQIDDAMLIVSELATNATCHGGALDYTVTCTHRGDSVEITVAHGGCPCVAPRTAEEDDEHGRGLAIVAMTATAWGVGYHADGTRIWARLALPTTKFPY